MEEKILEIISNIVCNLINHPVDYENMEIIKKQLHKLWEEYYNIKNKTYETIN